LDVFKVLGKKAKLVDQEYASIEYGKKKAMQFASESKGVLNKDITSYFKSSSAENRLSELADSVINGEF